MEEAFNLYTLAHRPPIRIISERVQANMDLPGTACHETIRRMLVGKTVPRWGTAQSIFLILCELAEVDPEDDRGYQGYDSPNYQEAFTSAWNEAMDEEPEAAGQVPASFGRRGDDPWGASAPVAGGSYDAPPF